MKLMFNLTKEAKVGSSESAEIAPATLEFSTFTEPDPGVTFDYPTSLTPYTVSSKYRRDDGIVANKKQVSAVDAPAQSPALIIYVLITEIIPREGESWPPKREEDWAPLFAFELHTNFDFVETQQDLAAFMEAIESPSLTTLAGYPAAEYSVALKNFRDLGGLMLNGALLITDTMNVHVIMMDFTKTGIEHTFTRTQAEQIWDQLLISLSIPEPSQHSGEKVAAFVLPSPPQLPVLATPDHSLDCRSSYKDSFDLMDYEYTRHLEIIGKLTRSALPYGPNEEMLTDDLLEESLDEAALLRKRLMLVPIPRCLETFRDLRYRAALAWEQAFYAGLNLEQEKYDSLLDEAREYAQDASEVFERLSTDLLQQ